MSLTTVAEVRALVETPLEDADLQGVIEREEAWLARRVGALAGPRAVVIQSPPPWEDITLPRPTSAVTVTDNGASVTTTMLDARTVLRGTSALGRTAWVGPVSLTFTPSDEDEVKRVVIELVREAVTRSPYESESIGDYSYTRAGTTRYALARSLMAGAGVPRTVQLGRAW